MDPFSRVIWHLPSTHSFHAPIQLLHSFHMLFSGAVIWGAVPTAVLGRVKPTVTIVVCYYRGRVSVVMLHFCDFFPPSHRASFIAGAVQTNKQKEETKKRACVQTMCSPEGAKSQNQNCLSLRYYYLESFSSH
jgi:hypothetical protein